MLVTFFFWYFFSQPANSFKTICSSIYSARASIQKPCANITLIQLFFVAVPVSPQPAQEQHPTSHGPNTSQSGAGGRPSYGESN